MKTLDELCIGDVLLLPIPYGISRVVRLPFFEPGGDRRFVKLILEIEKGMIPLTCTRNMSFEYLYGLYG